MSLETAINENTQAVKMLAELMAKLTSDAVAVVANATEKVKTDLTATQARAAAEAKTEKSKTPAAKTNLVAKTETQSEGAADSVATYDDVKKAILAYQQAKGRDATVKALATFGATKGTDLKPEQFAAALALFTA